MALVDLSELAVHPVFPRVWADLAQRVSVVAAAVALLPTASEQRVPEVDPESPMVSAAAGSLAALPRVAVVAVMAVVPMVAAHRSFLHWCRVRTLEDSYWNSSDYLVPVRSATCRKVASWATFHRAARTWENRKAAFHLVASAVTYRQAAWVQAFLVVPAVTFLVEGTTATCRRAASGQAFREVLRATFPAEGTTAFLPVPCLAAGMMASLAVQMVAYPAAGTKAFAEETCLEAAWKAAFHLVA